jgi:putative intracellular protease/amidase
MRSQMSEGRTEPGCSRKTSFWLEEFAAPYFVFRDAGVELALAYVGNNS